MDLEENDNIDEYPHIKLPDINTSNNFDIQEEEWNIKSDYNETIKTLTEIKNCMKRTELNNEKTELDSDSNTNNNNNFKQELYFLDECLKFSKQSRISNELDICEELKKLNSSNFELLHTKSFHKICNYEPSEKGDGKATKQHLGKKQRRFRAKPFSKKNFPSRSLNKCKMNSPILTEKEKAQLGNLLADIDLQTEEENIPAILKTRDNAFKSNEKELSDLKIIDGKLQTLRELYTDAIFGDKHSQLSSSEDTHDWKEFLNFKDRRLQQINEKLTQMRNQAATEQDNDNQ